MGLLRALLAVNGAVFLLRGLLNIVQPTSFYLESDAPAYAQDAVRILGITYLTVGLVQLGTWWVSDRRAVRIVAGAGLFFAAGVAIQAATQQAGSSDSFHELALGSAAENAIVATLYAVLLLRESRQAKLAA